MSHIDRSQCPNIKQNDTIGNNRRAIAEGNITGRDAEKIGEHPIMNNRFFKQPTLNSPYEYPARYWELEASGQPMQEIIESSCRAEFITPIPSQENARAPLNSKRWFSAKAKVILLSGVRKISCIN